ncbi:helix-turn-helix domain-containing protein [Hyphococcus sp.]|uniref:helix-turn-helix domain-containing protein n=1 Tax=Hyphococcus sp. TaxID=2038636 RepID=UPI003CCBF9E7
MLDGEYEETSIDGRFSCRASSIVWHPAFHLHSNKIGRGGAVILNLPSGDQGAAPSRRRTQTSLDADYILQLAHASPVNAARAALEELGSGEAPPRASGWIRRLSALLAQDAREGRTSSIRRFAAAESLSPEHISRQFKLYFGVSPARYRREKRVRRAMKLISGGVTIHETAYRCGFSDQSHLTREFRKITGMTPGGFIRRF